MLDLSDLSDREQAVLELSSEGLTDREIAERLQISPATVSSYWVRIRGKLGHFTRTEFVGQYLKVESEKHLRALLESNRDLEDRAEKGLVNQQDLCMAQFYRTVLTGVPDPLLVLNSDGCIEFANDRVCAFLGCTGDQLLGQRLEKFFPNTFAAQQVERIRESIGKKGLVRLGHRAAMFLLRSNGLHARVTIHINTVEGPAGPVSVCILRSFIDEIEAMRDRIEVVRNSLS